MDLFQYTLREKKGRKKERRRKGRIDTNTRYLKESERSDDNRDQSRIGYVGIYKYKVFIQSPLPGGDGINILDMNSAHDTAAALGTVVAGVGNGGGSCGSGLSVGGIGCNSDDISCSTGVFGRLAGGIDKDGASDGNDIVTTRGRCVRVRVVVIRTSVVAAAVPLIVGRRGIGGSWTGRRCFGLGGGSGSQCSRVRGRRRVGGTSVVVAAASIIASRGSAVGGECQRGSWEGVRLGRGVVDLSEKRN